jgi:hypothetical protein
MDRSKLLTDAELLAQAEAENHRLKKTIIETTEENKTKRSKMQAMKERLKSSAFMDKHKVCLRERRRRECGNATLTLLKVRAWCCGARGHGGQPAQGAARSQRHCHARACRRWKSDCSDIRRRHLCRCIVGHQVRACACCTSASESCCDLSSGSLVPDGNSENVAVLLQEVQGSIPKLKQASDARSLCPFSLSL